MTTVVIIIVAVLVVAAGLFFAFGRTRGGRGLRSRFGPEYERAVARHDGDTHAAEQELGERVKRYGSLDERPLSAEARAEYAARWTELQEQFVDSPQNAVAEADALLARMARDRGFPDAENFDEQMAALSVHRAEHVNGYRRVHTARRGQTGTEEMREALIEARGLFDALLSDGTKVPAHAGGHHPTKESGTS
ncbi:hypothetical protein ACPXCE_17710 [Streptomyces sp. DT24]|uniref:hypothetical protein n=1 Tax=unclassified Streptomyces TaxID=2593676 RepID=UPI0023B9CA91|nr:hypothetical protein [Streptomyces sp. AM 4-1-1]WEH32077.1 hypothetical protein PZB75_00985 [Streptomyces sp. AM 4-1-1]